MAEFNIEQYDITVTYDDNNEAKEEDKTDTTSKLYPDLSKLEDETEKPSNNDTPECTLVLKKTPKPKKVKKTPKTETKAESTARHQPTIVADSSSEVCIKPWPVAESKDSKKPEAVLGAKDETESVNVHEPEGEELNEAAPKSPVGAESDAKTDVEEKSGSDSSLNDKQDFECKNLRKWLLDSLVYHRNHNPAKIALIEEIGEVRCVTYEELVDGSKKAASYMCHHGVKKDDRILMCMENTVEYVLYQLGAFLIGAIPVFINPSHIASEKLFDIGCSTAIVDFEHYGHILRICQNTLTSIQRVIVLAEDIAAISLARHVWIIDGFGFLSFPTNYYTIQNESSHISFILPGSLETEQYVSHSQESGFHLCHDYFEKLFDKLKKSEDTGSKNHLITDGLHCHDALSYLFTILAKGETCILAESTLDVWRSSLLDRIAGIIEQYKVSLLFSNSQLLKCFIRYEVHKIYDLSSLEIIANHGAAISVYTARKIKEIFNVTLIQAYSGAEFGVASFGIFDESIDEELVNCGLPIDDMKIKIGHMETDKEMEPEKWGQIILSEKQLLTEYVGNPQLNKTRKFGKMWFKTGDYGMIDKKGHLHIEGAIADLITAQGKEVSSEKLENILCQHKLIHDVVVMQSDQHVQCGVLLKNEEETPTIESVEKLLKKHQIPLTIQKVMVLDFIPRTEKGKVIRSEIPYLMNNEKQSTELEETTESYI